MTINMQIPPGRREFMSLDWLAATNTCSSVSKPTEMKGVVHALKGVGSRH